MKIYDLKEKQEFLQEVMELEFDEWAKDATSNRNIRIKKKINNYFEHINDIDFCKLILVDEDKLVGFISIFPSDCEEEKNLFPWYATMFVKKEYRGKGCSKILNSAILEEAKRRKFKQLYLKTELNHYYEKFGATFVKNIDSGEKIFKFEVI